MHLTTISSDGNDNVHDNEHACRESSHLLTARKGPKGNVIQRKEQMHSYAISIKEEAKRFVLKEGKSTTASNNGVIPTHINELRNK